MTESGVIDKVALVYGQMNEPPGARLRVGLSGLTMAEYFRDQGQDVLLFIDNIFRFVQAGSEVSALLGRMPSAVGYQPTLATEMGELQERITSDAPARSPRCRRSTSPPTTSPIPRRRTRSPTSTRRRALPRDRREGHLSGRRPARLDLARAPAGIVCEEHYHGDERAADPPALQGPAGHHRHPRHGRADRRGQAGRRARPQDRAVPLAAELRRRAVHWHPGQVRQARGHDPRLPAIIEGEHDELGEAAFYMVGTIDDAVEKARETRRSSPRRRSRWPRRTRSSTSRS